MHKFAIAAFVAVTLAGCSIDPELTWLRADGQSVQNNSLLETQEATDELACLGAQENGKPFQFGVRRNAEADSVGRRCMAEKGYLLVPKDQAEKRRAELAAAASEPKSHPEASALVSQHR